MGSVDIVIVNWNAGTQLAAAVRSVLAHDGDEVASIAVVDNASHDGSADTVEGLPLVTVIRSPTNLGFGRACNLGAGAGQAPFILLLNPDVELIEPAIGAARRFLESDEGSRYGICGVRHVDERGTTARHCARFPAAWTGLTDSVGLSKAAPTMFPPLHLSAVDHAASRPVDHVMGAFYLIRRSLFEQLDGFDERFFVYLEDLDLSRRAAAAGAGSFYLADSTIFHRGGGTSRQIAARALFYGFESKVRYGFKHFGFAGKIATALDAYAVMPLALGTLALLRRKPRTAWNVVRAWAMLMRHTPAMIRLGGSHPLVKTTKPEVRSRA